MVLRFTVFFLLLICSNGLLFWLIIFGSIIEATFWNILSTLYVRKSFANWFLNVSNSIWRMVWIFINANRIIIRFSIGPVRSIFHQTSRKSTHVNIFCGDVKSIIFKLFIISTCFVQFQSWKIFKDAKIIMKVQTN